MIQKKVFMADGKYGVLFPGCGIKFLGSELEILESLNYDFDTLLNRAENVCKIDIVTLRDCRTGDFADELQSQFATYIYSCALSDILIDNGIATECCAGYSMGIYAALYHARAVSFEDGLLLIEHAYYSICKTIDNQKYGIAVIVGLTLESLVGIIKKLQVPLEIINQNNEISYVISGRDEDVLALMQSSNEEGALRTIKLPLSVPYHSVISRAAVPEFNTIYSEICINTPVFSVISCVYQDILCTPEEIKRALSENIGNAINWQKTMEKMIYGGVNAFIECGPGESLTKACKFIDGNYTVKNISKIQGVLGQ
jgi:[acyl-carrier-protein] S-malonyltransferase